MAERLKKSEWIGKDRHLRVIQHHHVGIFPLHAHDGFEVEIALAGEGRQNLNGRECPLRRGTVCWLSPTDVHEIFSDGELTLLNVAFDETVVTMSEQARLSAAGEHCRQVDDVLLAKLNAAAFLLCEEEKTDGEIRPLIEYFLTLCIGSAKEETLSPIQRAALFIETHFREKPTLADAARAACLSPVYFGERFKKEMGKTYVQYLNECRLRYACQLFQRGLTVTEVCFASGFGSLSGFLYAFKKQLGSTPERYRRVCAKAQKSESKNFI